MKRSLPFLRRSDSTPLVSYDAASHTVARLFPISGSSMRCRRGARSSEAEVGFSLYDPFALPDHDDCGGDNDYRTFDDFLGKFPDAAHIQSVIEDRNNQHTQ